MSPDGSAADGGVVESATSAPSLPASGAGTVPAPPRPNPSSTTIATTSAPSVNEALPTIPEGGDNTLMMLLGGAALFGVALGAWQLSRRKIAKEEKGGDSCEVLKQSLETTKQEIKGVDGQISIQTALIEALQEKVYESAKERVEDKLVGALGETAKKAKETYDDLKEKCEQAQKTLELLQLKRTKLGGEVDRLEAAYAACRAGVLSGGAAAGNIKLPFGDKKSMKFRDNLAQMILEGKKDATWRLFDDKNLTEGDTVDFINWNTKEKFGEATLVKVWEKKMGELAPGDYDGHEKFADDEDMYRHYRTYYGDKVGPDSAVKIIKFKFRPTS